jgi:hypothetical protein
LSWKTIQAKDSSASHDALPQWSPRRYLIDGEYQYPDSYSYSAKPGQSPAAAKGDEPLPEEVGKHWDLKREAAAPEGAEKPFVIRFAKH